MEVKEAGARIGTFRAIFFLRVWRALTIGDYDPIQPGAPRAITQHKKSTIQATFALMNRPVYVGPSGTPTSAALEPTGRPSDYPAGAMVQKQNH